MPNSLRNVLAVLAGVAVGAGVTMALIALSPSLIPLPAGVDPNDTDSLKQGVRLLESRRFVMPFLAHEGGTLYTALTIHADEAGREAHAQMGFHQGWGAALDQLVDLMKRT